MAGERLDRVDGKRLLDPTPATEVTIRRGKWPNGDPMFVVSDEDGEFACTGMISDALHYASDLLHGPRTGPRGTVWNMLRAIEEARDEREGD